MNKLHLMIGIQGSGKTTFAKKLSEKLNCKIVSTDMIRKNNPSILENDVWPLAYNTCANYLKDHNDVIFDATSITPKVRNRIISNIKSLYSNFIVDAYFFDVDCQTCISRVIARNQNKDELFLPIEVIENYYQKLVLPSLDEGFNLINIIDENGNIKQQICSERK